MAASPFKTCPKCQQEWQEKQDFICDPDIKVTGYSVNYEQLEEGLFFFNHVRPGCSSTLATRAGDYTYLYTGQIADVRLTDEEGCPRYCQEADNLRRCNQNCECAFVREIIATIKEIQQIDS